MVEPKSGSFTDERSGFMRRFTAMLVAAGAVAVGAILAPVTPVYADNGNGNWSCDTYEICFRAGSASDWDRDFRLSKTFYYGNMQHNQEYLCDPGSTCIVLMDSADGFWNRDSSCSVKLWDVTSGGAWYYYAQLPRNYRADVTDYRNNGHSRC